MGNSNSRSGRRSNNDNLLIITPPNRAPSQSKRSGNRGPQQDELPPAYTDATGGVSDTNPFSFPQPGRGSTSTSYPSTPASSSRYAPPSFPPPNSSLQRSGTVEEDRLEILRDFNTVFLIDDSSSMWGPRWKEARDAVAPLADIAARYDADGLDIHFLNHRKGLTNVTKASEILRKFNGLEPVGSTPTGFRLEQLLGDYMSELENAPKGQKPKPVNFVVITDGEPTDDPESVIVAIARRLDRGNFPLSQVGIQFVQVGNDARATAALREMDDNLSGQHGIRDIVDTTPYQGRLTTDELTKCLIGGINRRVDRERNTRRR